jgi:hypothetical protein
MTRSNKSNKLSKSVPPAKPAIPLPKPAIPTPPTPSSPGFMDTMFQGFAWGTGSSLARRIFEPKITPESVPAQVPNHNLQPSILTPDDIFKKYQECLERNDPNVICETLLDKNGK